MSLGLPELLIILVIVVLLFGVGRISQVSGEIGKSIKAFRKGLGDDEDQASKKDDEKSKDQ